MSITYFTFLSFIKVENIAWRKPLRHSGQFVFLFLYDMIYYIQTVLNPRIKCFPDF